jgi:hypothetical protein
MVIMAPDIVVEMDDIDMTLGRIEMARDKLTPARIARSAVLAKSKSKDGSEISRKSNPEAKRAALDRVKTLRSTGTAKTVAR